MNAISKCSTRLSCNGCCKQIGSCPLLFWCSNVRDMYSSSFQALCSQRNQGLFTTNLVCILTTVHSFLQTTSPGDHARKRVKCRKDASSSSSCRHIILDYQFVSQQRIVWFGHKVCRHQTSIRLRERGELEEAGFSSAKFIRSRPEIRWRFENICAVDLTI